MRVSTMVLLQTESIPKKRNESARQPWPDAVALREALQNPAICLTSEFQLDAAEVATDRSGLPLAYTGRFAIVFRLSLPGDVPVALRVFTAPDLSVGGEREIRCQLIDTSLQRLEPEVGDLLPVARYIPQAVHVHGKWYPAQLMPWAFGTPLLDFVSRNIQRPAVLRSLESTLMRVQQRMRSVGVVHGDLQHDNILVSAEGEQVILVDYDCLYNLELSDSMPPPERGHPNYQHPKRSFMTSGADFDQFSFAVIRTSLLLLANAPQLWDQWDGERGEGLLFSSVDFQSPPSSTLFEVARHYGNTDPSLMESVSLLNELCAGELAQRSFSPNGQSLTEAEVHFSEQPLLPSRVSPKSEEEVLRPVSYLARLTNDVQSRVDVVNAVALRTFLLVAPGAVILLQFLAWSVGGAKWPFLAYLFTILVLVQILFLYLVWPVKRQLDALDIELFRLQEECKCIERRCARLLRCRAKLEQEGIRGDDTTGERLYLIKALSQIPISRAIGEMGVSAELVRLYRQRGIETAAHLYQRHGFLPAGTPGREASSLRTWLREWEQRERRRYSRENDPQTKIEEELSTRHVQIAKCKERIAFLNKERNAFPDASFWAFLLRAIPRVNRTV